MAKRKSQDKRNAIMAAAIHVIASQGLGAATATIAKAAGVANGSLFNYFETKAELLNALYVQLEGEIVAASMDGLPSGADLRGQAFHAWSGWMQWGVASPDKRKTLAQLAVSDDITAASRGAMRHGTAGIAALIQESVAGGPLRDQSLPFIAAILEALAGATIDHMISHPAEAGAVCEAGFATLWRAIS